MTVRDGKALGRSRKEIAARIAGDLEDGYCVNLGIGIPLLVANEIRPDADVLLHTENGLLGMGEDAPPELADPDLIGAGKGATTVVPGASVFDSSLSFAIVRRGRLDVAILGALEVSTTGRLANWLVPGGNPGVGGAMDLVQGAKQVWVAMDHVSREGRPKLVAQCRYPVTGVASVSRVYTNLAVFHVEDERLVLVELAPGVTVEDVAANTEARFDVRT